MKQIQKSIKLILCGIATLLLTLAFAAYKMDGVMANVDDGLIAKKENVVSCSPNGSNVKKEGLKDTHEKSNPENKGSGNGCAHQQVSSALCINSESKRRLMKNHGC